MSVQIFNRSKSLVLMKTDNITIGIRSPVKMDKSLDKHAKINLFKKKFDESTAALLKTDLLFKLFENRVF